MELENIQMKALDCADKFLEKSGAETSQEVHLKCCKQLWTGLLNWSILLKDLRCSQARQSLVTPD
jgi:hypothetical protein